MAADVLAATIRQLDEGCPRNPFGEVHRQSLETQVLAHELEEQLRDIGEACSEAIKGGHGDETLVSNLWPSTCLVGRFSAEVSATSTGLDFSEKSQFA